MRKVKTNKSFLFIIWFLVISVAWFLYAQTSNQWNWWYKLSTNKTAISLNSAWNDSTTIISNIYEYWVCRRYWWTTDTGLFVPTKTSAEYTAFRNNKPSNITLNDCPVSCWSAICSAGKCSESSLRTALWKQIYYQNTNSQICWCHNSWAEVRLFQKYSDPCNRSSQWTYKAVCNGSDSTWRFWYSWWTPITDTSGIWWTAACHSSSSTCTTKCSLPWSATTYIQHGDCVDAYQSPVVSEWSSCVSQQRQCLNWALNGSYLYESCVVEQWYTCKTTDFICTTKTYLGKCHNTNTIWAHICGLWDHKADCTTNGWQSNGWCDDQNVGPCWACTSTSQCPVNHYCHATHQMCWPYDGLDCPL